MFYISYDKMKRLLNSKGISLNNLKNSEIITDTAYRNIKNDRDVHINQIAKICRYMNIPIEEAVEVIHESESPESDSLD